MKGHRRRAQELLPLTPAFFHVLLALAEGPVHGYAIMQEVEARTDGRVRLGPGTLYGAIKRLRELELIEEAPGSGGDRRRCYRLTELGRATAEAEALRLEGLVRAARATSLFPRERTT